MNLIQATVSSIQLVLLKIIYLNPGISRKDILKKYKQASDISKKCKEYGRKLAVPGAKYLEISEKIEAKIREMGADLAFPVNISVNNIAAHYCASELLPKMNF